MRGHAASVRLRATVAATLVVAVALGIAATALFAVLRGSLVSSADAEAARRLATAVPGATAQLVIRQRAGEPAAGTGPASVSDTTPHAVSGTVPDTAPHTAPDTAPDTVPDTDVRLTEVQMTGADDAWAEPGKYVVANKEVTTPIGPAKVWARASLASADEALTTLTTALLPGVPALLAVVAGMTWLAVGRALAPVAAIRAKVADITARDLHQRVPVPRSSDEISGLAVTVNATLDRLETAVETHKRFVADAAHELRSPIATLRARLELARPSELTREALADVERLQSLAADLLLLARLDAGEPLRTGELDLGQVAAEAALRSRRRPDVRLDLDVQPDVVVRGSRAHLDRLVTNLTDNAARHAAGVVRVRVRADGDRAVLDVLDDGPGVPPEHREAVFDRFTRLDEARARDAGGAGLGLPIARDIALLHGGTLVCGDGGFTASLPLACEGRSGGARG
uniref:ATP-binding protein n=1 Tax=Nonomuraea pusilla TaxID=46177 RepID=UPI0007C71878|nr:ATP-binding protein [Nonomuraea pusilla]